MPLLGVISNIATASKCFVFADLRPTFPMGPAVCLGGGGGEEEGQQASSLSSKHKLWNFHRYRLVLHSCHILLIKFTMNNVQIEKLYSQFMRNNFNPRLVKISKE